MPKLSKSDRAFLRSVGIRPTAMPPTLAEERMELAQRIARHQAPQKPDAIVKMLRENGLPLTRENYLYVAYLGNPPAEPLDGEIEAELPWYLQWNAETADA